MIGRQESKPKKAAFLDRDGVLNEDSGYVHKVEDIILCPGVLEGLKTLQSHDFLLLVITNQSGIAQGFYNENDVYRVHRHMDELFAAEGIAIDGWYYCPHHPDGPIAPFGKTCDCRKPDTGMVAAARADFPDIDMKRSFFLGDKDTDIECGRRAGANTIQFLNTKYRNDPLANFTVSSFAEAVDIMITIS